MLELQQVQNELSISQMEFILIHLLVLEEEVIPLKVVEMEVVVVLV